MWSFIDFLVARARQQGLMEQCLLYLVGAVLVCFVFLVRVLMY